MSSSQADRPRLLTAARELGGKFRLFWGPYGVLSLSDGFRRIAVLLWVYEVSDRSGWAVAAIMLAEVIPRLVTAPFVGVFVDRAGPGRAIKLAAFALAGVSLTQAGVALARQGVAVMIALVALAALAELVSATASESLLPRIVVQEKLQTANAVLMSTYQAALIVGPPLGAFMYERLGRASVFLADAAVLFVAALLLLRLPSRFAAAESEEAPHFWSQMVEGFRYLIGHPVLLLLASTIFLIAFSAGINSTAMVFFMESLGRKAADVAWLGATNGLFQLLAGGFVVAFARRIPSSSWLLGAGLAVMALGAAAQAAATGFLWLIVAVLVVSVGNNPVNIAYSTLLQTHTKTSHLGRVKALTGALDSVVFLLGAGVAGALLAVYPARALLVLSASAVAASLALYLLVLRRRLGDA